MMRHLFIQQKYPNFVPKIAIVLGSGLGIIAEQIQDPMTISYDDLPGFPQSHGVKGHAGQLWLGTLCGVPVICLQGRAHFYETGNYDVIKTYVRTMRLLGCEYYFATNAAGSFHQHVPPGSLVLIDDHINGQPGNPLVGSNDDEFGTRFPPMDDAYDETCREWLLADASSLNLSLHKGVYYAVSGPCFETAAEIKAFALLGADVVGMSTVPEIIVAQHCGMKSIAISTITNYATGLSADSHDHDNVLATAGAAAKQLTDLIMLFVKRFNDAA